MFRRIINEQITITDKLTPYFYHENYTKDQVYNSQDLYQCLKKHTEKAVMNQKAALMLSGGMDSAILASFMPKGSTVYTLKCVVPGIEVLDETKQAAIYADKFGLKQKIVEIYWEDYAQNSASLMKQKGAPFHSIEVQIYKAALQARADGFDTLIFGESADTNYGGMSNLLSKDWTIGEFMERYSYVMPYKVLKDFIIEAAPYKRVEKNGYADVHEFCRDTFYNEAMGTYSNACNSAGIIYNAPYSKTYLASELDYARIRSGENKYLIREVFQKIYPDIEIPPKTPMPRPMDEWLNDWDGPTREEFWPNCQRGLTGDQKWLVYILEQFLNMVDTL